MNGRKPMIILMLGLLLCLLLSTAALAETQVSLGETDLTVGAGETVKVLFTADRDGYYIFTSLTNDDTYGYLYDPESGEETASDDDSGTGNNFQLTKKMSAGDSVLVGAKFYSDGEEGTITLSISFSSDGCIIDNGTLVDYIGDATELTIPSGVTCIGDYAFLNCSTLESVTIPAGVTQIGANAFKWCQNLQRISIPSTVTKIGSCAFYGCSALTGINLPEGITEIEGNAFSSCSSLESITIPSTVTKIGSYAFYRCSGLTNINLPEGITEIEDGTFDSCSSLKEISLPKSLTRIYAYAFNNCSALESVTIPVGVTLISDYAFAHNTNLQYVSIPTTVIATGCNVFEDCSSLTGINLPEGLTELEECTFSGCESLKEITLPESLEYIYNEVFYRCSALESITIPSGVTYIGNNAFTDCTSLSTVDISDSLFGFTEINSVFSNTPWLQALEEDTTVTDGLSICRGKLTAYNGEGGEIVLTPEMGITSIASNVFADCSTITRLTLCEGIKTFAKGALCNENLKTAGPIGSGCDIEFPWTDEIPAYAFCESNIQSVTIPDTVTKIGNHAFHDSQLTSLTIPSSVKYIGESAFCSTPLTYLTIPDSVESIGNAAFDCSSLRSVKIGKGVKSIGKYAFSDCDNLVQVILSAGLETIGEKAFAWDFSLTHISIPSTVTDIGTQAFTSCCELADVYMPEALEEQLNLSDIFRETMWAVKNGVNGNLTALCTVSTVISGYGEAYYTFTPRHGGCYRFISDADECRLYTYADITADDDYEEIHSTMSGEDFSFYITGGETVYLVESVDGDDGSDNTCTLTIESAESSDAGLCGDNVTAVFDRETATLTLSGTGRTYNWTNYDSEPAWCFANEIEHVVVEDGVTGLGEYLFYCCYNLKTVTLADSVDYIGYGTFMNCNSLQSVDLGKGLTSIGDYAFHSCLSLTSVTIPDSVESLAWRAFGECASLTGVTIGSNWLPNGEDEDTDNERLDTLKYVFSETPWLLNFLTETEMTNPGSIAGSSGTTMVKFTAPQDGVYTFSGEYAGDTEIEEFYVNSLFYASNGKQLDDYAYEWDDRWVLPIQLNMTAGETVYIALNCPYSYTFTISEGGSEIIDDGGLGDDVSYTLTGDGVLTLTGTGSTYDFSIDENYDLWYIHYIRSIVVGEGITHVGDYLFYHCEDVVSVQLPSTLQSIGKCAFRQCTALTSVTIPDSVVSIGRSAFADSGVKTVQIRSGLLDELETANIFYNTPYLKSLVPVTEMTAVGTQQIAPDDGQAMLRFTAPETGMYAFTFTSDTRTKITVTAADGTTEPAVTSKQYTVNELISAGDVCSFLLNGTGTVTVTAASVPYLLTASGKGVAVPENVIQLPASLKTIRQNAFDVSAAEYVIIPDGCERIENYAFINNPQLALVRIPQSVQYIGINAFRGSNAVLIVKDGSYAQNYAISRGFDYVIE